jgi:aconitase A
VTRTGETRPSENSWGARDTLTVGGQTYEIFRIDAIPGSGGLPYSLKVLLENLLRTEDGVNVTVDDVRALADWAPTGEVSAEIQFTPARVVMQDFTGVPCVVDLATMREAVAEFGGNPEAVNPLAPAELVIDHSVIIDVFARSDAFARNVEIEYERNRERYQFLRWGQRAFDEFKVVPPGTGIVHQVNIEHLARTVMSREVAAPGGETVTQAYPDTLVGTDSHTTMVGGLGVLGWGVGGIEAEAAMLGAGLLARNAVETGLSVKPWVKTSMAPGSQVVTDYYERAGLWPYLEKLGYHLVGYGCSTCIGNSGPLPEEISEAVQEHDLAAVSVLSGNRNFEGRINPDVAMNYLASPPLLIAYALAGTMDFDFEKQPLGTDERGRNVFLGDIWPSPQEIQSTISSAINQEMYAKDYADVFAGDERWHRLPTPEGTTFDWDPASTYVRKPPYFEGMPAEPEPVADISGARVPALLGDSVTTDHISPAGAIKPDSPAGKYLSEQGVARRDFNSYGSRRGNHEVMIRGTFANIRLRNLLLDTAVEGGVQGGYTRDFTVDGGPQQTIYDAAQHYARAGIPLVVLAGREYGSGSSRDWAAKGTALLGVRAVIAESFERIHRSNLIGMGVAPLQFPADQTASSLGLDGTETYDIAGLAGCNDGPMPQAVTVTAHPSAGDPVTFDAVVRIDTPGEANYYRHGGILQYVLRRMVRG